MMQRFKSVYFADYPSANSRKRHVKLALGPKDADVYEAIRPLSSCELRDVLGVESFAELRTRAAEAGQSLNGYCVEVARSWVVRERADQLSLFRLGSLEPHCTFEGARDGPVNRWFPWLEGYSPSYVEGILSEIAPRSKRVLDPFAGTGSTPLAVARMGGQGMYCEINPLLQLVTRAKVLGGTLPKRRRVAVQRELSAIAKGLPQALACAAPDRQLADAYTAAFGKSAFFSTETLNAIFRLRTIVDSISSKAPDVGMFVSVASVAALLPSSLLKRAGDVRFRREHELHEIANYVSEVVRRTEEIVCDLQTFEQFREAPVLLTSDAKDLAKLPSVQADAVITSPPYLNGTNYFRNTKLELWFLRALRHKNDLAAFRSRSVTAGINDVTRSKIPSMLPSVAALMAVLEVEAYDRRIPRMVGSYFRDMEDVLRALSKHLKPGAKVAIDIGDSAYAGVHVPTDDLLLDLALRLEYRLLQKTDLRSRVSRDRTVLKQTLLVLEWHGEQSTVAPVRSEMGGFRQKWQAFKTAEPHRYPPFAARNWGHSRHSLCSYQGKLKPSLAHHLVNAFVPSGGRLLDPFGGVGTIPLEAALQAGKAFSFDISPAAHTIAQGKLADVSNADVEQVLSDLESYIASNEISERDMAAASKVQFNGPLASYFHPVTFHEILLARRFFITRETKSDATAFVQACLLHVLHGNRPYALSRRSHPITPFAPSGDFVYKAVVDRLRKKIQRVFAESLPEGFVAGSCYLLDATESWPQEIADLDAVITSPPFFDSTRFHVANWMRLWFSGWNAEDFATAPAQFVDERQKAGFAVYRPILRQARERLRDGAPLVMHLGRSKKCDMVNEIVRVAEPFFKLVDRYTESVRHCESHGIKDKGTVTDHEIVVLV